MGIASRGKSELKLDNAPFIKIYWRNRIAKEMSRQQQHLQGILTDTRSVPQVLKHVETVLAEVVDMVTQLPHPMAAGSKGSSTAERQLWPQEPLATSNGQEGREEDQDEFGDCTQALAVAEAEAAADAAAAAAVAPAAAPAAAVATAAEDEAAVEAAAAAAPAAAPAAAQDPTAAMTIVQAEKGLVEGAAGRQGAASPDARGQSIAAGEAATAAAAAASGPVAAPAAPAAAGAAEAEGQPQQDQGGLHSHAQHERAVHGLESSVAGQHQEFEEKGGLAWLWSSDDEERDECMGISEAEEKLVYDGVTRSPAMQLPLSKAFAALIERCKTQRRKRKELQKAARAREEKAAKDAEALQKANTQIKFMTDEHSSQMASMKAQMSQQAVSCEQLRELKVKTDELWGASKERVLLLESRVEMQKSDFAAQRKELDDVRVKLNTALSQCAELHKRNLQLEQEQLPQQQQQLQQRQKLTSSFPPSGSLRLERLDQGSRSSLSSLAPSPQPPQSRDPSPLPPPNKPYMSAAAVLLRQQLHELQQQRQQQQGLQPSQIQQQQQGLHTTEWQLQQQRGLQQQQGVLDHQDISAKLFEQQAQLQQQLAQMGGQGHALKEPQNRVPKANQAACGPSASAAAKKGATAGPKRKRKAPKNNYEAWTSSEDFEEEATATPRNGPLCHEHHHPSQQYVTCTVQGCQKIYCVRCMSLRYGEDGLACAATGCWVCPCCRTTADGRPGCGHGCDGCCVCSTCRKERGLQPTGVLVWKAKEKGFSNAHDFVVHEVTGESADAIKARKDNQPWSKGIVHAQGQSEEPSGGPKAGTRKRKGASSGDEDGEDVPDDGQQWVSCELCSKWRAVSQECAKAMEPDDVHFCCSMLDNTTCEDQCDWDWEEEQEALLLQQASRAQTQNHPTPHLDTSTRPRFIRIKNIPQAHQQKQKQGEVPLAQQQQQQQQQQYHHNQQQYHHDQQQYHHNQQQHEQQQQQQQQQYHHNQQGQGQFEEQEPVQGAPQLQQASRERTPLGGEEQLGHSPEQQMAAGERTPLRGQDLRLWCQAVNRHFEEMQPQQHLPQPHHHQQQQHEEERTGGPEQKRVRYEGQEDVQQVKKECDHSQSERH